MEEQNQKPKSKFSAVERGLVIGAVVTIDLVQLWLNGFVVGLIANRFIDILVGLALWLYFLLKGIKMTVKQILTMVSTFLLEEVPVVDSLPFWTLDVIAVMAFDAAEEKLERAAPVVSKIDRVATGVRDKFNKTQ